jgi:hypothetical protein
MKHQLDTQEIMEEMEDLSFWDAAFPFLESLARKKCKFILIGNIACKYHGLRVEDCEVDILVSNEQEDMDLLMATLQEFPWGQGVSPKGQLCAYASFYLSMPLCDGTIDIINETAGIEFNEAYGRALNVKFGKLSLKVLHRDDLINNKSLLDDPRHLDDAIELSMLSNYDA